MREGLTHKLEYPQGRTRASVLHVCPSGAALTPDVECAHIRTRVLRAAVA
jgi:hypothetical protein